MLKSPFTANLASKLLGLSLSGAFLTGQPIRPNWLRNIAVFFAASF